MLLNLEIRLLPTASGLRRPRGLVRHPLLLPREGGSVSWRDRRTGRRSIRIDVEHGRSVLGGRPTQQHTGIGQHRVTNARVGKAGCAASGYRNTRSKRPIPRPSLPKQGCAEPSGSRSRLVAAFEPWETGNGREPRSSEGGGPINATSMQTRSFNHPWA